jgi:uncharacterized membrane protein
MHIEAWRNVDAPAEIAWQVLTDVERMPEWTASMRRVERLDAGPLRVGSRARIEQPGLQTMVWTVTRLEPGRSFAWETAAPGVRVVGGHAIEPEGNALRCSNEIRMTGWLAPLLALLAGARVRRYAAMELEGWKRRSESLAAGSHDDRPSSRS